MTETVEKNVLSAGVYVGAKRLDCALAGSRKTLRCDNSDEGRAQLIVFLRRHGVERVGLGASDDAGAEMADKLSALGFEVIVYRSGRMRVSSASK